MTKGRRIRRGQAVRHIHNLTLRRRAADGESIFFRRHRTGTDRHGIIRLRIGLVSVRRAFRSLRRNGFAHIRGKPMFIIIGFDDRRTGAGARTDPLDGVDRLVRSILDFHRTVGSHSGRTADFRNLADRRRIRHSRTICHIDNLAGCDITTADGDDIVIFRDRPGAESDRSVTERTCVITERKRIIAIGIGLIPISCAIGTASQIISGILIPRHIKRMRIIIPYDKRTDVIRLESRIQSFQVLRDSIRFLDDIVAASLDATFRIELPAGDETGIVIGNRTHLEGNRRVAIIGLDHILRRSQLDGCTLECLSIRRRVTVRFAIRNIHDPTRRDITAADRDDLVLIRHGAGTESHRIVPVCQSPVAESHSAFARCVSRVAVSDGIRTLRINRFAEIGGEPMIRLIRIDDGRAAAQITAVKREERFPVRIGDGDLLRRLIEDVIILIVDRDCLDAFIQCRQVCRRRGCLFHEGSVCRTHFRIHITAGNEARIAGRNSTRIKCRQNSAIGCFDHIRRIRAARRRQGNGLIRRDAFFDGFINLIFHRIRRFIHAVCAFCRTQFRVEFLQLSFDAIRCRIIIAGRLRANRGIDLLKLRFDTIRRRVIIAGCLRADSRIKSCQIGCRRIALLHIAAIRRTKLRVRRAAGQETFITGRNRTFRDRNRRKCRIVIRNDCRIAIRFPKLNGLAVLGNLRNRRRIRICRALRHIHNLTLRSRAADRHRIRFRRDRIRTDGDRISRLRIRTIAESDRIVPLRRERLIKISGKPMRILIIIHNREATRTGTGADTRNCVDGFAVRIFNLRFTGAGDLRRATLFRNLTDSRNIGAIDTFGNVDKTTRVIRLISGSSRAVFERIRI